MASCCRSIFSVAHNPTQLNYQGPDHGTQYRSTIFVAGDEQKKIAESYIAELDKAKLFSGPIVTTLEPFKAFYPAEDYHQDFLIAQPDLSLHRLQRSAEGREPEADLPRPLQRQARAGFRGEELSLRPCVRGEADAPCRSMPDWARRRRNGVDRARIADQVGVCGMVVALA